MTQKSIDEQIAALKAAGAKALVSKEAALAFLRSAGIPDTPAIDSSESEMIESENLQEEVTGHA